MLMRNHWKITKYHVFFQKVTFKKKKRPLPGCLQTVVRSGDAPKPPFPIKTIKKSKKSGNQPQINHRNYPLFLSLPSWCMCRRYLIAQLLRRVVPCVGTALALLCMFTGFDWKWGFWCIPTPDDCDQHLGRVFFFCWKSLFGKTHDI